MYACVCVASVSERIYMTNTPAGRGFNIHREGQARERERERERGTGESLKSAISLEYINAK